MPLQPLRPPGRADRKAGPYAAEILRLRAEGYTYEAIREALESVGITLTESALRREVKRQHMPVRAAPPSPPTSPPPPRNTSGREIAEAFFNANPSNPLLPHKDRP